MNEHENGHEANDRESLNDVDSIDELTDNGKRYECACGVATYGKSASKGHIRG